MWGRAERRGMLNAAAVVPEYALGIAVVVLACFAVYLPSLLDGLPHGDSYFLNVNWSKSFIEALSWQNPYPRWLPGLWEGIGAADFYFYAPLPFYLIAAIDGLCSGCDIESSITLSAIVLRVIAALGAWRLVSALGTRGPAFLAALFIAVSPYQLLNWDDRQALSELAGAAILPFALHALHAALRGRGWIGLPITTALIALTHLPSLVIFFVLAAVLSLTVWRPFRLVLLVRAAGAGTLGMAISAFYWLPAITLMHTVSPENLGSLTWQDQLLDFGPEDFQDIYPKLWIPFAVLVALSIAALLIIRSGTADLWRGAGVILILCVFLVTPLSAPVWEHSPIASIQFPWRFFIAADLAFALLIPGLAAIAMRRPGISVGRSRAASMVLLGFVAVALFPMIDWWKTRYQPLQLTSPLEHRIGTLEWLGRDHGVPFQTHLMILDAGHMDKLRADPRVVRTSGPGNSVRLIRDSPTEIVFAAACPAGCTVELRRGWWSLWQLKPMSGGQDLSIYPTSGFSLIAADLPLGRGEYRLVLEWPVVARQSLWLSVLACWAVFALWSFDRKAQRQRV